MAVKLSIDPIDDRDVPTVVGTVPLPGPRPANTPLRESRAESDKLAAVGIYCTA
jgi:hypothetical protein